MNIDMSHALFRDISGKPHIFDSFFVHARNLRYVHIPPHVSIEYANKYKSFFVSLSICFIFFR